VRDLIEERDTIFYDLRSHFAREDSEKDCMKNDRVVAIKLIFKNTGIQFVA